MACVCIILSAIAVLGIGNALYYRKQIKSIKEQVKFLNHHKTNMLIASDHKTGCIAELTRELNDLIEQTAILRRDIENNEIQLKETIFNLSHDIRTPLTSLDGYFQLLLKSNDPLEQQQYEMIINNRLSSLKEMLDELFTYAKLTNKAYQIELSPCAINEILLNVLFSFYEDIKQQGLEPLIDIPEKEICILANESALRRIFQNILKNCMIHGQKHLSVSLTTNSTAIQIRFENDYSASESIDAEKVFERFYKADNARSKISTGLGLSIAKELVQQINGSILSQVSDNRFTILLNFQMNEK